MGKASKRCRLLVLVLAVFGVFPYVLIFVNTDFQNGHQAGTLTIMYDYEHPSVCSPLQQAFSEGGVDDKDRHVRLFKRVCADNRIGNVLPRIYTAFLLAKAAGASFTFNCLKGENAAQEPFLSLFRDHVSFDQANEMGYYDNLPTLTDLCSSCDELFPSVCDSPSINLIAPTIRTHFRLLATKYLPNVTPSDVAVHYRCGDALTTTSPEYGLLPHETYARLIMDEFNNDTSAVQSIAILTQSFDPSQLRKNDEPSAQRCQLIVEDLVLYLKDRFRNATISIHNDATTETIARTINRLVSAKRATICGPSTFCCLATMSSLGTGYLLKSGLYPWMNEVARQYEDVRVFNSSMLSFSTLVEEVRIADLPDEAVLKWLRDAEH